MVFLGLVLLLQLYLDLIRAWQLLLALDGLDAVFLEDVLLGDDDLPHVVDHPLLDLHVDFQLDILQFEDVVLDDDFWIGEELPKVSLFSLERILRMMSSRIFLVAAMLSMIWRLVISFLSMFLLVLSFSVWITLLISFIVLLTSTSYSHPSFFFISAISPLFLRISSTFSAFCSSISIIALRSWILSLKF